MSTPEQQPQVKNSSLGCVTIPLGLYIAINTLINFKEYMLDIESFIPNIILTAILGTLHHINNKSQSVNPNPKN